MREKESEAVAQKNRAFWPGFFIFAKSAAWRYSEAAKVVEMLYSHN